MVVSKEISKYELLLISYYTTTPNQIGFVYSTIRVMYTWGMQELSKPERRFLRMSSLQIGILNIYFHEILLSPRLDTLRNEKTSICEIQYRSEMGISWNRKEATGEQEI
jgi:hypothetical protein